MFLKREFNSIIWFCVNEKDIDTRTRIRKIFLGIQFTVYTSSYLRAEFIAYSAILNIAWAWVIVYGYSEKVVGLTSYVTKWYNGHTVVQFRKTPQIRTIYVT